MNPRQSGAEEAHWKPLHHPGSYLETELHDRVPNAARTACQRCRDQKLKCSRDRPACSRCSRQQLPCSYPLPPNRKLIASSRKRPKLRATILHKRRLIQTIQEGSCFGSSQHSSSLLQESHNDNDRCVGLFDNVSDVEATGFASVVDEQPCITPTHNPFLASQEPRIGPVPFPSDHHAKDVDIPAGVVACLTSSSESSARTLALLPTRAIGFSLLEVYFERIYNSSLLFHKSTLFRDYMDDKLPSFLLRSIFALASLFLRETHAPHNGGEVPCELLTMALFHKNGRHWAQAASQEVLAIADQPSLATSQSLQCLTLYWFAVGKIDRADIHLTLAYRACCISKYIQLQDSDHTLTSALALDHELKRRCFWACWASLCIASEPRAYATSAWSEVANLPLPSTFHSVESLLGSGVGQKMDADWQCSTRGQKSRVEDEGSIWAEIMKIVGVWVKIQLLATESLSYSDDRLLHRMAALSKNLKSICQSETFSRWMINGSAIGDMRELRIFLTSLCHICHIVLHATVVPLFSGRSFNVARTPDLTRNSGDTILSHATMMGRLSQEHLSTNPDITKLSPLVGFAAFISGSVLVISAKSQKHRGSNGQTKRLPPDTRLIESCLATLSALHIYWTPLQRPWEKLQHAVLVMKQIMPLRQNRQGSRTANEEPPQHTSISEEQADTSFIHTRYCSKSRPDPIPQNERGAENPSTRENFGSIDTPPTSHSEINTAEQAAHQDGLLTSASIPELGTEGYAMSCDESMTESISEDGWLQFLLTSSWQEDEGHAPYEPLLPLVQQFY